MPKIAKRTEINPLWSITHALQYGYVIEPHRPSSSFTNGDMGKCCAVNFASVYRNLKDGSGIAKPCEPQCGECAQICYDNDYIRGKLTPKYPMPTTLTDSAWANYPFDKFYELESQAGRRPV